MISIDDGQVTESDLVGPTLRLLATAPAGFMKTSDLIVSLNAIFNPTGKDAEIATNRKDTYFSQKVRNMVSHRDKNFISVGQAEYEREDKGLTITDVGRALLSQLAD